MLSRRTKIALAAITLLNIGAAMASLGTTVWFGQIAISTKQDFQTARAEIGNVSTTISANLAAIEDRLAILRRVR